ncbi:dihydrolipoamide acetyltransferase family protein [Mycobacterium sp.]|uniref:dihydrolipoamide acetyltransferase family protein n=1 Tax=Mycobacterium sp. TaxID=1785 RepID=UPI002D5BDB26|nr:dihydrolipoamide acetyltransferase family protein [Mycobacterium sp.]HZA11075.1 dihydrolipoamide acetyltransferase family protein [Mycobacterium sp.]
MTNQHVQDFRVPDLGEGLEDATITSWSVAVGDHVELNQTLCMLETNKAEVEIPSPYAGEIVELGGAEGDTLDVGSVLVRIETQADQTARKPVLVGYGVDDDIDSSRRTAMGGSAATREPSQHTRPRAAPVVRKLASDLAIDLTKLQPGSGAEGVITRQDVLAAADATGSDVVPVRGIRARMAKQMLLSRTRIPDAHASVQVDCTDLLRLRDHFRDAGANVTPFVLTLRLVVIALSHHPVMNSTWADAPGGPEVHTHRRISLGFGVATDRGLLVPVIADAKTKTTRELGDCVARLIHAARDGTLTPTQLQGSTFTVSNYGALGIDDGVPVINYPEAAILGMGSLKKRAVVVDCAAGSEIVARPTMTVTCAFDHRIADGAQAAEFLGELRRLIEAPETALLDL